MVLDPVALRDYHGGVVRLAVGGHCERRHCCPSRRFEIAGIARKVLRYVGHEVVVTDCW